MPWALPALHRAVLPRPRWPIRVHRRSEPADVAGAAEGTALEDVSGINLDRMTRIERRTIKVTEHASGLGFSGAAQPCWSSAPSPPPGQERRGALSDLFTSDIRGRPIAGRSLDTRALGHR